MNNIVSVSYRIQSNVEPELLITKLKTNNGNTIDLRIIYLAWTLNFYSPMAYKYVHQVFNKS